METTRNNVLAPSPERIRLLLDRLFEQAEQGVAKNLEAKSALAQSYRDAQEQEHTPHQVLQTIERSYQSYAETIIFWEDIIVMIRKAMAANTTVADDLLTLAAINTVCASRILPRGYTLKGDPDSVATHVRLSTAAANVIGRVSDAFVHVADSTPTE